MPAREMTHFLPSEGFAAHGEHVLGEVDVTVAGRLGTDERGRRRRGPCGENARPFVDEALVLPEEVADLAAAHVHVAGGDVGVGADVAVEFRHEAGESMTSRSLQRLPGVWGLCFGLKSEPPLPPPIGRVVRSS